MDLGAQDPIRTGQEHYPDPLVDPESSSTNSGLEYSSCVDYKSVMWIHLLVLGIGNYQGFHFLREGGLFRA